ncbi:MAG: type VI secretion system contractile sheath large subunit [Acidobacteriia bacterium]|nr:type VI secretion system contractile sheath large subunit [Terriglobia bacterium]
MAKPFSFGEINLDVDPGGRGSGIEREADAPFHMLVVGDFSGRASRGVVETGSRLSALRPVEVDRDNLDDVMAGMHVELQLPVAGSVRFKELDDFHPDRLYRRLPLFDKLKQAYAEILKPARRPASAPEPPPPPQIADLHLGGLLDQAVEQTESRIEQRPARAKDPFQSWLKGVVAPEQEPAPDPRPAELESLVDSARNAQMRALMHFPDFQALEAAWHAVDFLVRRVETDSNLKIFLLDVSKEELADGAPAGVLLAKYAGGTPWAVIACNYRFGHAVQELQLLSHLGAAGRAMGASVIAEAEPSLATDEAGAAWEALRSHSVGAHIGLVLPRFLLRLPYGKDTGACEDIRFEEMGGEPDHDRYLWANPSFACLVLLAESFASRGWDFRPGMHLNLDGLPLHSYEKDGAHILQPCAEYLMTEKTANHLLERGLMPLASLKESDSARLVRFQSIAMPAAPLAGRWG